MNNTQEFIKLVQENPDLPIVPMVDAEIVCGDDYGWWLGSFGCCEITEYVCVEMYGEDRFVARDDQDEIEEYFADKILNEDESDYLSDEQVERMAHEQAEALDWIKAIIMWIRTP